MLYGLAFLFIVTLELGYFWVARRFNITDTPNERSSHTRVTIRGGGIIFFAAVLLFELWSGFRYPWFFVGTAAATLISFLDDIYTLPSQLRLPVQLAGVSLLLVDVGFLGVPWWLLWLVPIVILGTGIVNVFNFMDGINGITGLYGLVSLVTLGYLNRSFAFADERLIVLCILSIVVFGFFNFRSKAVCFAGDVGSVSLAFVIVFLLFKLILVTGNYYFILLLALYGVDSSLTILRRFRKRENIFEPHRSHLYQQLVKPGPFSHLQVAFLYAAVQLGINGVVTWTAEAPVSERWLWALALLTLLSLVYLLVKGTYQKRYQLTSD